MALQMLIVIQCLAAASDLAVAIGTSPPPRRGVQPIFCFLTRIVVVDGTVQWKLFKATS